MWAMSVPMANAIGKPRMFRPGVTIQAPPIPKKPPMTPTEKPISASTRPEDVESGNGHIHVQPVHIKTSLPFLIVGLVFDNLSGCEVESGVPHDLVSNETQAAPERGGDYRAPDSEHERIGVVQMEKEFCETPLDHTIVRYNNEQVGLSSRGQNQVRKQQANHG